MTTLVFLMVLGSASLHVLWNTLVKKCDDKASFAWLMHAVAAFVVLPLFVCVRIMDGGVLDMRVWMLAALSGLIEATYIVFLFRAYEWTDLSVVYPLSRGFAPLVTWVLGTPLVVRLLRGLVLAGDVGGAHGLAVAVLVLGVVLVSFSAVRSGAWRRHLPGVLCALVTGSMIAGYHIVDKAALARRSDGPGPHPVEYLFLMQLFLWLWLTVWMLLSRKRRATVFVEWRTNRRNVLFVGAMATLAYLLIMFALARGGNVTYVAAGRNVGIVLSTLIGGLLLKERVCWRRWAGVVLITGGVLALILLGDH